MRTYLIGFRRLDTARRTDTTTTNTAVDITTTDNTAVDIATTDKTPRTDKSIRTSKKFVAPWAVALLAAGLTLVPVATASANEDETEDHLRPVRPVASLDLQRYAGKWLQLANIPAPFSAQCVKDTQAMYTPLEDGTVKVINTCTVADGSTTSVEGRARVTGPDSNAQLEVTFVQFNGEFQFRASGAYWVLGLDQRSYSWAVVGDPTRTNGFVLSRTPTLNGRQIASIVRTILRNGYDPCRFAITATTGGIETNRPLCEP
jgi:apolipoprotein D and lipocalin family protein